MSADTIALERKIIQAWENRQQNPSGNITVIRDTVELALDMIDQGTARVAEKINGEWVVNEWVKKSVLLAFATHDPTFMQGGARHRQRGESGWFDKIPPKFAGWDSPLFAKSGFRAVPGAYVRRGAFIGKGVMLMPSFVNIGAYVDDGTMIDTWANVGSCAQIGKNCHIANSVGIGGVLEPVEAKPVIIEDNCYIGAHSEIGEGMIIEEGAVIGMGVYLSPSTKIVDRATGEVFHGRVPAYAVVVPGTLPPTSGRIGDPSLYCAVIVKKIDASTREKADINELLRA